MPALLARDPARGTVTDARLAGLSVPRGGFTAAARRAALERVRADGLPSRRDEYWKFTPPGDLTAGAPEPLALFDAGEEGLFAGRDAVVIVFTDGVFDAARSSGLTMAGVEIERLAEADRANIHLPR
jgi:Fe-S cluster assembly protein SufD